MEKKIAKDLQLFVSSPFNFVMLSLQTPWQMQDKSRGGIYVKRFEIPHVTPMTGRNIRFPNDLIEEVEACIGGRDCTFSAFVVEAVRVVLTDLQEQDDNDTLLSRK